jgi:hypothetical protein
LKKKKNKNKMKDLADPPRGALSLSFLYLLSFLAVFALSSLASRVQRSLSMRRLKCGQE